MDDALTKKRLRARQWQQNRRAKLTPAEREAEQRAQKKRMQTLRAAVPSAVKPRGRRRRRSQSPWEYIRHASDQMNYLKDVLRVLQSSNDRLTFKTQFIEQDGTIGMEVRVVFEDLAPNTSQQ